MIIQEQEKLNTFHQKQLHRFIRKQYQDRISNKKLCEKYK